VGGSIDGGIGGSSGMAGINGAKSCGRFKSFVMIRFPIITLNRGVMIFEIQGIFLYGGKSCIWDQ
jgi:hypothetical protein